MSHTAQDVCTYFSYIVNKYCPNITPQTFVKTFCRKHMLWMKMHVASLLDDSYAWYLTEDLFHYLREICNKPKAPHSVGRAIALILCEIAILREDLCAQKPRQPINACLGWLHTMFGNTAVKIVLHYMRTLCKVKT